MALKRCECREAPQAGPDRPAPNTLTMRPRTHALFLRRTPGRWPCAPVGGLGVGRWARALLVWLALSVGLGPTWAALALHGNAGGAPKRHAMNAAVGETMGSKAHAEPPCHESRRSHAASLPAPSDASPGDSSAASPQAGHADVPHAAAKPTTDAGAAGPQANAHSDDPPGCEGHCGGCAACVFCHGPLMMGMAPHAVAPPVPQRLPVAATRTWISWADRPELRPPI